MNNRKDRQKRRSYEAIARAYLRSKGSKVNDKDREIAKEIELGTALPVDKSKIHSSHVIFEVPEVYRDISFVCHGCGINQVWKAHRQKWWYEEAGGDIESKAILCRECRAKERKRKFEARRIQMDGIKNKKR